MGFMTPDTPAGMDAAPQAPKAPRPTGEVQGAKPKRKSMQETFVGDSAAPTPGQSPGKTLLGQ
jgi:hypothetical protein